MTMPLALKRGAFVRTAVVVAVLFLVAVTMLIADAAPALALECAGCHTVVAHPAGNDCVTCHPYGTEPLNRRPSYYDDHRQVQSDDECLDCHEPEVAGQMGHYSDPFIPGTVNADGVTTTSRTYECQDCHNPSRPSVPPAHGEFPPHTGALPDAACGDCHTTDVLSEHGGDCWACHSSTDPKVIAAIAADDLRCDSCHPGAHYAGASLDPYLTWAEANMIAGAVNGSTPHGGYAVNTTKCAVCHSAHRAQSDLAAAGVGSYWKLTPGAQACVACHTPSGANPVSTALVEWSSTYSQGGPHSSFQCLGACHAGVHGGMASEYGAVRAWNLTSRNDAALAAAFAAGNAPSIDNQPNSDSVASNGGSHGDDYYASFDEDEFRDNDFGPNDSYGGNQGLAVMRAMVTGYTCGAAGCHSSSQFAVNQNGYAELRASNPAASSTLDQAMTGHSTNMIRGCEPCHASRDSKCAACHDMKGKATNSSAFPHANRNIVVLETEADGSTTETTVASGNLWMYAGDATMRDTAGAPSETGTTNPSRKVIDDAAGFHDGNAGNINDGTCLKCHGMGYFGPNAYHSAGSVTDFTRR